jgi:cytoskeletal protein CcmA (bactofilin family)
MKFGQALATAPTKINSHLREGVEINGEVRFTEILRVDTKISGKLTSEAGCLLVSEQGHVRATVEAGFVEVFGTVEGDIRAKHKVEIHSGGQVYGDIFTPVLNVEPGAIFDGACHMADGSRRDKQKDRGIEPAAMDQKPAVAPAGIDQKPAVVR